MAAFARQILRSALLLSRYLYRHSLGVPKDRAKFVPFVDLLYWRAGCQCDRWVGADVHRRPHHNVLLSYFLLCFVYAGGVFVLVSKSVFGHWLAINAMYSTRYRPAYKAFKDDSSANFMLFFFVFFFQLILMVLQTIGLANGGTIGIITCIKKNASV